MRRRARGARARARAVGGPSAHLRVLPREDDLALHLLSNHERFRQSKRPRTYTLFAAIAMITPAKASPEKRAFTAPN